MKKLILAAVAVSAFSFAAASPAFADPPSGVNLNGNVGTIDGNLGSEGQFGSQVSVNGTGWGAAGTAQAFQANNSASLYMDPNSISGSNWQSESGYSVSGAIANNATVLTLGVIEFNSFSEFDAIAGSIHFDD